MKLEGPQLGYTHQGFERILGTIILRFARGIYLALFPYSEDDSVHQLTRSLFSLRLEISSRYCIVWIDILYQHFGGYLLFEKYYKRRFNKEINAFTANWPDDDIPF